MTMILAALDGFWLWTTDFPRFWG